MNKLDFRLLFPRVRDQGIRGTCLSFAVTAAHELARHNRIGKFEDLSEEALHWKCKQIDGNQHQGTSFDSASEALEQVGQPHAEKWPYDGLRSETNGSYIPPVDALDPGFCFKAKVRAVPVTVDAIKNCLVSDQAVILGIEISDAFLTAPNGRIPIPITNQAFTGGHAVLVVGYEEDAIGKRWLIFRNSWGIGWGDQGYGYLPCEYIEMFGGQAMVIEP